MQHPRYVVLIFALGGVLLALSTKSASVSLFEQYAVADLRVGGLVEVSSLLSLAVGVVVFAGLLRSGSAVSYIDEVVDELHKVTWPTRDEAIKAATTVVMATLFMSALIGFYDLIWKALADRILFSAG